MKNRYCLKSDNMLKFFSYINSTLENTKKLNRNNKTTKKQIKKVGKVRTRRKLVFRVLFAKKENNSTPKTKLNSKKIFRSERKQIIMKTIKTIMSTIKSSII